MQFSTLITIVFVLFLISHSVHSNGEANCACRHSLRWTRDCCGPTGGYFIYRKCYHTFGLSFIQCCRSVGLRGACVA